MELIERMAAAFKVEGLEFTTEEVKTFPVKDGQGYYVNRGAYPYSRGTLNAYVYIEWLDGETDTFRPESEQELKLWTEHLG